ncbi:hypothetical protein [Nostoc sp.]
MYLITDGSAVFKEFLVGLVVLGLVVLEAFGCTFAAGVSSLSEGN